VVPACQVDARDPKEQLSCTKIVIQAPSEDLADAKTQIADAGFKDCIAYNFCYRNGMWIRGFGPIFSRNSATDETWFEFNFDFWGVP
jgi:agmatine/peptidylarginine deiminase